MNNNIICRTWGIGFEHEHPKLKKIQAFSQFFIQGLPNLAGVSQQRFAN